MPNKKALVVGINDYGSVIESLSSCVNDSNKVSELLRNSYDFNPNNVHKIQEVDATLANIQKELKWLFQDAQIGDRLVFYFSGHGHRTRRNGLLEECLVSSDGEYFFDDEFIQFTQLLPPGILSVIIDSCHSGGIEKSFITPEEASLKIKAWTPPSKELSESLMAEANPQLDYQPFCLSAIRSNFSFTQLAASGSLQSIISQSTGKKINGLFMAACQPDEKTLCNTRKTEGLSVFTFSLLQSVLDLGIKISNRNLFSAINQRVQDIIQDFNQERREQSEQEHYLDHKQVPLLIEPLQPQGLGDLSFITFEPTEVN